MGGSKGRGVGSALRQCVYQLKYRHLLLRNSVFFGGLGSVCVCVCLCRVNTQVEEGLLSQNSLGSLNSGIGLVI